MPAKIARPPRRASGPSGGQDTATERQRRRTDRYRRAGCALMWAPADWAGQIAQEVQSRLETLKNS